MISCQDTANAYNGYTFISTLKLYTISWSSYALRTMVRTRLTSLQQVEDTGPTKGQGTHCHT